MTIPLQEHIIESERLKLIPYHLENYTEVWTEFCRANSAYFINPHIPQTPEDIRFFLASEIEKMEAGENENRFIYLKDTSQFLGSVSVIYLNRSIPVITLWFVVESQGKGYWTEAYIVMLDWIRVHFPKVTHVAHKTLVMNHASKALAEKFHGFLVENTIEDEREFSLYHIPIY